MLNIGKFKLPRLFWKHIMRGKCKNILVAICILTAGSNTVLRITEVGTARGDPPRGRIEVEE